MTTLQIPRSLSETGSHDTCICVYTCIVAACIGGARKATNYIIYYQSVLSWKCIYSFERTFASVLKSECACVSVCVSE